MIWNSGVSSPPPFPGNPLPFKVSQSSLSWSLKTSLPCACTIKAPQSHCKVTTQVTLASSRGSQGECQVVASECEYKETKLGCRKQCVVVDHRLHSRVLASRPPILSPDIHAMFDGVKIAMDGMDRESTFSDYCILHHRNLLTCLLKLRDPIRSYRWFSMTLSLQERTYKFSNPLYIVVSYVLVSLYLLWTVFERMHQISIDGWHYNHNPYHSDINLC